MEFLILRTSHQLNLIKDISIKVGDTTTQPPESARNLEIHFDSKVKWTTHVNILISTLYL